MSWNIATTGTPDDCRRKVEEDKSVPQGVRDAIDYALTSFRGTPNKLELRTSGHINVSEGTGNLLITARTV